MAANCSVCPKGKKASTPFVWCPDCDDLLCQSCDGHHSRSSGTKHHKVITYENYQKLPAFILKIRPFCTEHNEKFTDFCRLDDTPICNTCLKKYHRKCDDIPKIEDIVHKVKDSVLFEDTMTELEAICRNLKQIADNRNENLKHLHKSHMELKAGFEESFDNLIKRLTILKDKTLSDMDTVYQELVTDISNTSQIVQSKQEELRAILDQKDDILKYASNFQTFIGLKEMETIVNEVNTKLNELSNDDKLMEYSLKLDVNETIEDIVHGIQSLGDIQVTKSPSAVPLQITAARYLEAVKVVQSPVQLNLQGKIDGKNLGFGYFNSCCTLTSGHIVIAGYFDGNFKVKTFYSDKTLKSTIMFGDSDGVRDVTPVDDQRIAVSHPRSGAISIIDVDTDQVVKKLNIGEKVTGLCCRGRDIVCCVVWKSLVRVNIDSGKVEMVVQDESVSNNSHVEVSSNLICYTCPFTHTVTVLDTQFNVIFTYKDETVLIGPTGVTIDDCSNIYVTGRFSHNLVVISPDGKSCHQLLGKDDGLKKPTAVHYDSSTKKLVVVNEKGSAFIYSVQ